MAPPSTCDHKPCNKNVTYNSHEMPKGNRERTFLSAGKPICAKLEAWLARKAFATSAGRTLGGQCYLKRCLALALEACWFHQIVPCTKASSIIPSRDWRPRMLQNSHATPSLGGRLHSVGQLGVFIGILFSMTQVLFLVVINLLALLINCLCLVRRVLSTAGSVGFLNLTIPTRISHLSA